MDPASLGLAGLGALQGGKANSAAQKSADKAANSQAALIKRATDLFDMMKGIVTKADKGGEFDPAKQIQELDQQTANYESRDMGNTAGAARIAGYQPGDSPVQEALDNVKVKYRAQREQLSNQIENNAFARKLGAYGSLNPGSLNPGIGAYGQQQQIALGGMQNPGGFFASVSPFLKGGGGGGGWGWLKTSNSYGGAGGPAQTGQGVYA